MPKIIDKAVFCNTVKTTDCYGNEVEVAIYLDISSCGVFGIDASFIEQEEPTHVPSPFDNATVLELTGD